MAETEFAVRRKAKCEVVEVRMRGLNWTRFTESNLLSRHPVRLFGLTVYGGGTNPGSIFIRNGPTVNAPKAISIRCGATASKTVSVAQGLYFGFGLYLEKEDDVGEVTIFWRTWTNEDVL